VAIEKNDPIADAYASVTFADIGHPRRINLLKSVAVFA
jgi:hypothetical protein